MRGEMIELYEGQTWRPSNGGASRQIDQCKVAWVGDKYPLGTPMVCWAENADKWGWCSASSFRAWIRRTKAICVPW